ncbi:hypothetical protein K443DRAFT_673233 [Laccaria amethystina LaAM-08-1]|uniref:Transcription elongation factor Eaf N-terminal domain-containing protein n=1 Tax=Laccaria amethystina LaAM-08-1 TaxID=1095629 RepID=A0A0C9X641_9AGAR|nr:hypothetical protein K443DRAFT_673233 [Laccaria amethystina LaAM-08-1]
MATSDTRWMPEGRHPVNVGSSLGRALKARKLKGSEPATAKRSNLPDRDFYSFRYKFKPPSVDMTKPGTIEVKRGGDSSSVTVEYPGSQAGEKQVFMGSEAAAKEWECVLIYDEETGTYTLEKLDSCMTLTYQRKAASSAPRPAPATAPSPASKNAARDTVDEDILGLIDEDADGDVDVELVPNAIAQRREEEEEEEEEEIDIPPRPASPPKPIPKVTRPVKPLPKSRVEPPPAATPAPVPQVITKSAPPKPRPIPKVKKAKKEPEVTVLSDADEEVLQFGKPAKRARPSTPNPLANPISSGLALPGLSSSYVAPPIPPGQVASGSSTRTAAVPVPPPALSYSDSEEDWEPVEPSNPPEVTEEPDDVFGDDNREEIDVNDFEEELNRQMAGMEDEDFLTTALSEEPEVQPISIEQLVGGAGAELPSDDDYSSSDTDED